MVAGKCGVFANVCKTSCELKLRYRNLKRSGINFEFSFKGVDKTLSFIQIWNFHLVGLWTMPSAHYDYSFQTWLASPGRLVKRHLHIGKGWMDISQATEKSPGCNCVHLELHWIRWKLGLESSPLPFFTCSLAVNYKTWIFLNYCVLKFDILLILNMVLLASN